MYDTEPATEERTLAEFRRKIRDGELLSAATEKLLRGLRFSGKLSVVVRNGSIWRSGYEEGYYKHRQKTRPVP